jgi:hypothetical protein
MPRVAQNLRLFFRSSGASPATLDFDRPAVFVNDDRNGAAPPKT